MEARDRVLFGALLHDIGKLMQRAEVRLSDQSHGMEDLLCPRGVQGYFSHRHVLWTNEFLEKHFFPEWQMGGEDSVANLAAFHHRPNTELQRLVQKADWLSAGMDRNHEEKDEEYPKTTFKKRRLRSIFETIELKHPLKRKPDGQLESTYNYTFAPIALEREVVFPSVAQNEPESRFGNYQKLWEGFEAEHKELVGGNPCLHRYLDGLLALLEKYTWCVPSSTMDFPDISLFDHLKTTAAIGLCLYDCSVASESSQQPFLLLAGDLSGIQNFLYRIAQPSGVEGVARRLRGRSYYLTLLPEVIARLLLRECGFTSVNLLFCGGGRFEVLLANTQANREKIQTLQEQIEDWLMSTYEGELGLVTACIAASEAEIKNYGQLLKELDGELTKAKKQKYFSRFSKEGFQFREATYLCPSCNLTVVDQGGAYCRECELHYLIGKNLPEIKYIVYTSSRLPVAEEGVTIQFGPCGWVSLFTQKPQGLPSEAEIVAINHVEKTGFQFLANTVPILSQDIGMLQAGILDFSEIAQLSIGDSRLGVMKMDVDRLGLLFSMGLAKRAGSYSLSRVATLSRQIDLFFTGYLNRICRQVAEQWRQKSISQYRDYLQDIFYIAYAGGDDLLIFGPWSEIPYLAQAIKNEFKGYTCENPNISISAGIFLCKGKYPASRAAIQAGEELEAAKEGGRSRITFLGETVLWDDKNGIDFSRLLKEGENLYEAVVAGLPRGFLHQLLQLHRRCFAKGELDIRYIPTLVYLISRNIGANMTFKGGERIKDYLWKLLINGHDSKEFFSKIRIPASYALMKSRVVREVKK